MKGMIACLQHSNLTILNLGNLTTFNLSIFNKNLAIQKFSNFSVFNIGNFHFWLFSSQRRKSEFHLVGYLCLLKIFRSDMFPKIVLSYINPICPSFFIKRMFWSEYSGNKTYSKTVLVNVDNVSTETPYWDYNCTWTSTVSL